MAIRGNDDSQQEKLRQHMQTTLGHQNVPADHSLLSILPFLKVSHLTFSTPNSPEQKKIIKGSGAYDF